MKRILITGAARGLGRALGNFLSKQGHEVIGTTRNLKIVQDSVGFKLLSLDLRKKQSIERLANHFIKSKECIDVIIHNAGVAYLDPADLLDEDESRHIFDVNFFGPMLLTKKLLPQMRVAKKGHLLFISSIVSIDHWPFLGVYSASKAAIEAVAYEWAIVLKRWNINVSVVRPNPLQTDMQILRSRNTKQSPYPDLLKRSLEWEKIEEVCELVSNILRDPLPEFAYQTGPHSQKTADRFIKKQAYQKTLKKYQKNYLDLNI